MSRAKTGLSDKGRRLKWFEYLDNKGITIIANKTEIHFYYSGAKYLIKKIELNGYQCKCISNPEKPDYTFSINELYQMRTISITIVN